MQGFASWAERYSTLFGLSGPADAAMVQAWEQVFNLAGYRAGELEAATDWLAQNAPPLTRPSHLPAIRERVRAARFEQHKREQAEWERRHGDLPTCSDCSGTGWVVVPMLKSVNTETGEWDGVKTGRRRTCAVSCGCSRGERIAATYRLPSCEKSAANRERPILQRLEDYELANPDWRRQMADRDRELTATVRATDLARYAEQLRPALRRDLQTVLHRANGWSAPDQRPEEG